MQSLMVCATGELEMSKHVKISGNVWGFWFDLCQYKWLWLLILSWITPSFIPLRLNIVPTCLKRRTWAKQQERIFVVVTRYRMAIKACTRWFVKQRYRCDVPPLTKPLPRWPVGERRHVSRVWTHHWCQVSGVCIVPNVIASHCGWYLCQITAKAGFPLIVLYRRTLLW